MKTFILGLFATLLFAFNANAQKTVDSGTKENPEEFIEINYTYKDKALASISFNSFKEYESSEKARANVIKEVQRQAEGLGEPCKITITVTVKVTIGVASVTLTGTLNISCKDIAIKTKEVTQALRDAAISALSN